MPENPLSDFLLDGRGMGQGAWNLGDRREKWQEEILALRTGIELGLRLIDTAEMYGSGRSERLVGEAVAGYRDQVWLVSKVLPANASRPGVKDACEKSLARLKTDRLDLYLLHWRGGYPFAETIRGMEDLLAEGKILAWGVSNFDVDDLEEFYAQSGGMNCAANEILYNLSRREVEYALLPWCREHGLPVIAYSPVEQGRLLNDPTLARVAARRGATTAQVALAWVRRQGGVTPIPKAGDPGHVRDNALALSLELTPEELAELEAAYPAPREKKPLAIL
ncbi:MAG: aldo/keto reductase [Planctomycetota bacterium]|jgi:diketogulonate reductase-like aldo/keto reductase|nr:aldo/keto reductase [Planctomycetota bacterium]